ncbi:MAG: polysaccharide pyruvyl transferase family protein, partial [Hyphomicrobium sp.]
MAPRVLLTGIPSQFTRLIQRAHGAAVIYSERQPRPEGADAFLTELRNISNTGNYLIGEGALGALPSNTAHIPFWHLYNGCTTGAGLDEINANFDICVFTCANLLREGLSADAEALVLEHLNMPVVMLGIGIQKREELASSLPQGTRKLLQVIKQKEHYFLTRGQETASFLKDEGFSFVRPVGCPSIYFMPGNVRSALRTLPHVRIPQARTVFSGYLGDSLAAIDDINALTPPDSTSYYVIQDELLHFDMQTEPDESGRVYNSASG